MVFLLFQATVQPRQPAVSSIEYLNLSHDIQYSRIKVMLISREFVFLIGRCSNFQFFLQIIFIKDSGLTVSVFFRPIPQIHEGRARQHFMVTVQ